MRVLFDTEEFVSTLKESGVAEAHARALSHALDRAFHQGVATKDDIADLRAQMGILDARINGFAREFNARADGLDAKIDGFAREFNARIDGLDARIDGFAREFDARIGALGTQINGVESSLRTELVTRFAVQRTWMVVIAALVALSNPVMMHFYKAAGLFP